MDYIRICCYHCGTNLHYYPEGYVQVRFSKLAADVYVETADGDVSWHCPECGELDIRSTLPVA